MRTRPPRREAGFVRLGLNYFTSDELFDYTLDAVHFVAAHGWKLLPLYRF